MQLFQSIIAHWIVYVLGVVNLLTGILIVFTCRCFPGSRLIGKLNLMKKPAFQRLFKYHCYIWWVFWISVIVHAVFAIAFFGVPF